MIKSMTGYGKAQYQFADHTTRIEIKSVNSKQLDLSLKLPPAYRELESDIRTLLAPSVERGKVELLITQQKHCPDNISNLPSDNTPSVDLAAIESYIGQIRPILDQYHITPDSAMLVGLLRIPGVIYTDTDGNTISEDEKTECITAIRQAVAEFDSFRLQEGMALQEMFEQKLQGIEQLLASVEPYEKGRVQLIRQRLLTNLTQLAEETRQQVDQNRLEAEMIYYLEKLDITEEKVRLTNHIRYFRETMNTTGQGVGKKLGFITQEMGREINTLGSKSNQSEMQIIVVQMKDLLEQMKEQVLNVL